VGPKDPCIRRGVEIPPPERVVLGVVPPTEQHWESPLRCTQQNDHSLFNNGTKYTQCGRASNFFDHLFNFIVMFHMSVSKSECISLYFKGTDECV